ncbi:MAG TPA: T9SS type B sorting domain-containing protein [Flavobacteriales bacterium]|nr:T9SS type B sorting domain-containing protein [Flavobacteriales bacterium]
MKQGIAHLLVFLVFLFSGASVFSQQHSSDLSFIPNQGQWDSFISYRADLDGGVFWMEENGWTAWVAGEGYDDLWNHESGNHESETLSSHAWRVRFKDGNPNAEKSGRHELGHKVNYYRGSDETKWVSGLDAVGQVRYKEVWPGIELIMDGRSRGTKKLKYDWVVEPGADPSNIVLIHEGTELSLRPDGSLLHLMGETGDIIEGVPFAYQLIDGSRISQVECHYKLTHRLDGMTEVSFEIGDYNTDLRLTIDPDLVFATYIGATQANWGFTAAFDDDGRAIAGAALWDGGMGTYPTTAGAVSTTFAAGDGPFDIGITVFSADGTALVYSTIVGGNSMDICSSLVADSSGDFYALGTTGSSNFPVSGGSYDASFNGGSSVNLQACCNFPGNFSEGSDLFILKFSSGTGGLLSGTYVGGSGNDGINSGSMLNYNYGDVFRGEINVDELDRPWVATVTSSDDFPMIEGPYPSYNGGTTDGVLFRMSPDLSTLEWSSYIGGSQADAAYGVQFTSSFEPVVCGGTRSTDYPALGSSHQFVFGGVADAFVTRFPNGGGTPLASTYYGSSSYDQSYFVQVDEDDNIYLLGQTIGNLPLSGTVYDASPNAGQFIACFDVQLQNLLWNTRVGNPNNAGSIDISPTAFLVSDCGQIYLCGWGGGTNNGSQAGSNSGTQGMPITGGPYQFNSDDSDFWLGMLNPGAEQLIYGSFFGGGQSAEHVDGGTSRFDKNGTVYQAVCAGCGGNDDFPTTPGAWSSTNDSFNCNIGIFKFELGTIHVDIDLLAPDIICPDEPIQFVNNSEGGGVYLWQFGDGEISDEFEPSHTYSSAGDWEVTLTVSDPLGCLDEQSSTLDLTIGEPIDLTIDLVEPICLGEEVQLNAWGSDGLFWLNDPTLSATDIANPIATPTETTTYTVHDENECGSAQAQVTVQVSFVEAEANPIATTICLGENVQLSAEGGTEYSWFPTVGLDDPTASTVNAAPNISTQYTVIVTNDFGCSDTQQIQITVVPEPPGGLVYDPIEICTGHGTSLPGAPGDAWLWEPSTDLNMANIQSPYATPTQDITYTVSIQNICGIGTDEVSVHVIVPIAQASEDGGICRGEEFHVTASGNDQESSTYVWSPATLVSQSTSNDTYVFPVFTTTFTVYVTDINGCTASDELTVYVGQPPVVNAGPNRDVGWLDEVRLLGSTSGDIYWWTPAENLSCSYCTLPEVLSTEPGWYVFHALDENGCEGMDSTYLDVFYPIFVPTSFTPNNDGINDVFYVAGLRLQGYRLIIYNRWGEEVFYSEDAEQAWTGESENGTHYCPDAVYLYSLRYEDQDGAHLIHGHVSLLR